MTKLPSIYRNYGTWRRAMEAYGDYLDPERDLSRREYRKEKADIRKNSDRVSRQAANWRYDTDAKSGRRVTGGADLQAYTLPTVKAGTEFAYNSAEDPYNMTGYADAAGRIISKPSIDYGKYMAQVEQREYDGFMRRAAEDGMSEEDADNAYWEAKYGADHSLWNVPAKRRPASGAVESVSPTLAYMKWVNPVSAVPMAMTDAVYDAARYGDPKGDYTMALAPVGGIRGFAGRTLDKLAGKSNLLSRKLLNKAEENVDDAVKIMQTAQAGENKAAAASSTLFGDDVLKGVFSRKGESRFHKSGAKHTDKSWLGKWIQNNGQSSYIYMPADKIGAKEFTNGTVAEFARDNKAFRKSIEQGYGKEVAAKAKPDEWLRVNLADLAGEESSLFETALGEKYGNGTLRDAIMKQVKMRDKEGISVPYNPNDMKVHGLSNNYFGYKDVPLWKKSVRIAEPWAMGAGIYYGASGLVKGADFWGTRDQDKERMEELFSQDVVNATMKFNNSEALTPEFKNGFTNAVSNFESSYSDNPDAIVDMIDFVNDLSKMDEEQFSERIAKFDSKYFKYDDDGNPTAQTRDMINMFIALSELGESGALSDNEIADMVGSQLKRYAYGMENSPYQYTKPVKRAIEKVGEMFGQ